MARKSSKPAAPDGNNGRSPSKVDAVRQAISEGFALPEEGTGFVKARFGLDMTKSHFSAVKSQLKKREGSSRSPKVTRAGRPRLPRPVNVEAGLLDTLEALKPLVDRHGSEQLKRLVDLLG